MVLGGAGLYEHNREDRTEVGTKDVGPGEGEGVSLQAGADSGRGL